jgi:hypothetical protein
MITYKLTPLGDFAQQFENDIFTGVFANIKTNEQFKKDLAEGVELQDADGNVMSAQAVTEFLATLP